MSAQQSPAKLEARRKAVASMQGGFKAPANVRPPEGGDIDREDYDAIDQSLEQDE